MQLTVNGFKTGLPIDKDKLSFTQSPLDFRLCFVPMAPPLPILAALGPGQLVAHALDSGYGAHADLMGPGGVIPSAFQQFMQLRMRSAWKLLRANPGGYMAQPFVSKLDSTELGDASTILGAICARAAFEHWIASKKPGWTLIRFWHYSVYAAKSVGRWVDCSFIGASAKRPDYLVCARKNSNGQTFWYTLEAKGTLEPLALNASAVWEDVRDGMEQAVQINGLDLFPSCKSFAIRAAFCSHTRIDSSTYQLSAALVDPEPDSMAKRVVLIKPLAIALQLTQSLVQWGAMANGPAQPFEEYAGYLWRPLENELSMGVPLKLGVAELVYRHRSDLHNVVQAFNFLGQRVEEWCKQSPEKRAELDFRGWLIEVAADPATDDEVKLSDEALEIVISIYQVVPEGIRGSKADWGRIMSTLVKKPVVFWAQSRERVSVHEFMKKLDPATLREYGPVGHVLTNGLVVRETASRGRDL